MLYEEAFPAFAGDFAASPSAACARGTSRDRLKKEYLKHHNSPHHILVLVSTISNMQFVFIGLIQQLCYRSCNQFPLQIHTCEILKNSVLTCASLFLFSNLRKGKFQEQSIKLNEANSILFTSFYYITNTAEYTTKSTKKLSNHSCNLGWTASARRRMPSARFTM